MNKRLWRSMSQGRILTEPLMIRLDVALFTLSVGWLIVCFSIFWQVMGVIQWDDVMEYVLMV